MGNREDLLAGAKRCLFEKGYTRTSARDIAGAAGTSLAAIGYHFGSKEALLNAALIETSQEWGDELERTLAADTDPDTPWLERFETMWTRVIESFETHREMWATQFRILAEVKELPDGGRPLIEALRLGRRELGSMLRPGDEPVDERQAWIVGSLYQALLTGLLAQWLVDPEHGLTGHDIADALRAILNQAAPGTDADR
ncbi:MULTISPECIES: helix-turn-helix domain-containing protein [unclassified Micromonospora]|uniref:TetR/AcrR family transcriptional regulator n=1 Tax=unclassified Micromonospora TaxID=2617518 RepID=UPI00332ED6BC